MAVYVYRGTDRSGAAISGEQSAASKTELMNQLKRQQIKVSKLSEKGKEFNMPTFGGGVNAKDLAVFTRQFSVMIDCGFAAGSVLGDPGGPAGEQDLPKRADRDSRHRWKEGPRCPRPCASTRRFSTRSTSIWWRRARPVVFSTRFCSGCPRYIEKNVKLKRAVKSALVYPVSVLMVAAGVITLLLWKVVPIFAHVVLGLGRGPAVADPHCHRPEQLCRQHLRSVDPKLSDRLFAKGVFAQGIGFPTVARDRARVRTIVTATHTRPDLQFALDVFGEVGRELGII